VAIVTRVIRAVVVAHQDEFLAESGNGVTVAPVTISLVVVLRGLVFGWRRMIPRVYTSAANRPPDTVGP